MLNISDIKTGKKIVLEGDPYAVLYHEHSKTGRAGAVLRTRLKNLRTGAVLERTFQGSDKADEADVTKSKAQYLYQEGHSYAFMDMESYDQVSLSAETLAGAERYLVEGTEVILLQFEGMPLTIELPPKVTLTVVDAPPGIKGDSVSSGDKLVKLETGLEVTTPLFVKEGDRIIVNTEKGTYVSRA
ncbi:MAG: elongation factor P [Candidatus Moraniibacteriota bacterium]|nr:MAG: elongation factor P [Candidatus Moranbacteria bacterium]